MLCFREILVVLRIGIKLQIVFGLLRYAVPTVVVVAITIRTNHRALLAIRVVGTEIGMQTQVFKAVNLVIHFQVAYKRTSLRLVVFVLDLSHRVLRYIRIGHVKPILIENIADGRCCLVEPAILLVGIVVDRTRGVKRQCRTNDTTAVGVGIGNKHTLGVQVECQMVIQKRRTQVHCRRSTLHLALEDSTVLQCIAQRYTIRHVLGTARH